MIRPPPRSPLFPSPPLSGSAQLTAGSRGHAGGVVPLLAAAEQLPLRTASLDLVTAFNCVHHFDLGRFLTAAARVLAPDRKSTRLNSSHSQISYAVFCLKKKK